MVLHSTKPESNNVFIRFLACLPKDLLVAVLSQGYTADVINQLWATGLKYTLFHVYDCKHNNDNNNKVILVKHQPMRASVTSQKRIKIDIFIFWC